MLTGVISDTHGPLRPEAMAALAGVAHIIPAGDIGSPDIVQRLAEIAPLTAIRGNVDLAAWGSDFRHRESVELGGRSIYVLHDVGELEFDPTERGFAIVIFGHSHRPKIETRHGALFLNPGSAGPRRFRLPVTLATIELTTEPIRPEIHPLVG